MAASPNKKLYLSKAALPGVLTAIGMLSIILAKNWAVLSIGWTILAVFLVCLVIGRSKRRTPEASVLFELGPAIMQTPNFVRTWVRPLGSFILLLGLACVVMPMEEMQVPDKYGWGISVRESAGINRLGIGNELA